MAHSFITELTTRSITRLGQKKARMSGKFALEKKSPKKSLKPVRKEIKRAASTKPQASMVEFSGVRQYDWLDPCAPMRSAYPKHLNLIDEVIRSRLICVFRQCP